MNSYATYMNCQSCFKERAVYCELWGVGGVLYIDVGLLLSVIHYKISLIKGEELLLSEGVVSLL